MASIRQDKIAALLQRELSQYFREEARSVCMGAMVSVTTVRISGDLGVAKVYLSIFGVNNKDEVCKNIDSMQNTIRYEIGKRTREQLRKTPVFHFYEDDSLDYAEEVDRILNN